MNRARNLDPSLPAAGPRRGRVRAVLCAALLLILSGCGYVRVRVTPLPLTPTLTRPVRLAMPESQATSTPIPAAPLPTATPTATPTPVVHVVQEGDTLLDIASEYDVSLEALIEVNQIANPRALQVGQALIIPYDQATMLTAQPSATPTPMPLKIVNVTFHRTPVGSLWCLGEVENERQEDLELVQIEVSLYNAAGERVGQASSFTTTDIVPSHGRAPFALLITNSPSTTYASYEAVVLSAEPVTHWGRRYRALSVEQLEGEMIGDAFLAQGLVNNHGQADAEDVLVTLTAYGGDGCVVGVRQVDIGPLASGAEQPFSLSMAPAADAVEVAAVAWGMSEP
jgi:LysM repeat protein